MVALVAPDEEAPGTLTVEDRVALGRYPHRGPFRPFDAADAAAVARALDQTGIAHLARRPLATLSAGERQLAALARGLAQEPRVLLLDEPAAHLDVGHQLKLFRVLDGVRGCGVSVLAVVHDLAPAARLGRAHAADCRGPRRGRGHAGRACSAARPAALAFGVEIRAHTVPGAARRSTASRRALEDLADCLLDRVGERLHDLDARVVLVVGLDDGPRRIRVEVCASISSTAASYSLQRARLRQSSSVSL